MAKEYIEREAAIKAIENDCLELVYYTKEDAIQCVKAIPAADVAPVVHGRWIGIDSSFWKPTHSIGNLRIAAIFLFLEKHTGVQSAEGEQP